VHLSVDLPSLGPRLRRSGEVTPKRFARRRKSRHLLTRLAVKAKKQIRSEDVCLVRLCLEGLCLWTVTPRSS